MTDPGTVPDPDYRTATDDELADHDDRVARAKGWYWEEQDKQERGDEGERDG